MELSQIVIGVVGISLYWLLIKFMTNHKNVLAKPEDEQRKLKKQLYWGFAFIFVFYLGSQLLINSKTTGWVPWLVVGCYFLLWGIGGYLIWQAYRLGIKKEIALVKKSNGQLFTNPHKFIRTIAIINLLTGLSIWVLAIAIPIFKIKLATWAPFIVVISSLKQIVFSRFEKNDAT
ncbi:MAG: hypothetical protein BVN34_04495 [Proteobacteria bacterium ST_bin12]|nr:MAG: hypothetical protein BVN34_04495 [Proteobacteria bacterium ST_bin12]